MSTTSDILFAYLREVFYASPDTSLDIEKLEDDFVVFGKGLMFFAHCYSQYNDFAQALARGDLSASPPPPENELAAPLKSLHANLKHLSWQSQQVAKGDYKQRVDFMGEFADAFNTMVEQLDDRQRKLEDEINLSHKHVNALEQSNILLSNLTQHIPQQIFVVDAVTHEVLLSNEMAQRETETDPDYLSKLLEVLPEHWSMSGNHHVDLQINQAGFERYFTISVYMTEWNSTKALALVVNDVSADKKQIKELEDYAYRDALTHTFNRFYGMLILSDWLEIKRQFSLIFIDMDNLKFVNDVHGHNEGDEYIIRVSRHLSEFSPEAVVCRLGGDEFMLLIPGIGRDAASARMLDISDAIENDEYLRDKEYKYSVSFGSVATDEQEDMRSSDILNLADERMYEHKRARKKERRDQNQTSG